MRLCAPVGIAKRLHLLATALCVALAGTLGHARARLHHESDATNTTEKLRVLQLKRIAALELNVTRVSLHLRHALLARTPEDRAATLADIGDKRKLIDQILADCESGISGAEDRARFHAVPPLIARFWQVGGENIELIKGGKKDEALAFMVDKTIPVRNELLAAVGRVIETMKGTNESSNKIADIIGVIDSIAFQTSIPALNAAVEAARAGERGRGFAIVPAQVRTLAQCSAGAAREIKSLINDSVGRVEVGTALTQMDPATQHNAAWVEQSAAAAESLKVWTIQLVRAVSVFKLARISRGRPLEHVKPSLRKPISGMKPARVGH